MATGNAAGWRSALTEIERAIGDCLAALDRYEAAFAKVLGVEPGAPSANEAKESKPDNGAGDPAWERKLAAAGEAADSVEKLFAEQERVWGRWRAALADWQRLAGTPPG